MASYLYFKAYIKLLGGIYLPDEGEIKVRGKVGALIEIGAGFHHMLTGRENIITMPIRTKLFTHREFIR